MNAIHEPSPFSEKKLHRIGRIDQIVRDYFETNDTEEEVMAKDLMPLFIQKGIFVADHKKGLPIRNLLRDLDKENKLHLLKHVQAVRKNKNSNWYFKRECSRSLVISWNES